jgi:hypothetical protein
MSDQTLRRRLTQYARLFCGTVLLRDCPKLTRSFNGVQALEARLRSLHMGLGLLLRNMTPLPSTSAAGSPMPHFESW